jgi:hypothetical protein
MNIFNEDIGSLMPSLSLTLLGPLNSCPVKIILMKDEVYFTGISKIRSEV